MDGLSVTKENQFRRTGPAGLQHSPTMPSLVAQIAKSAVSLAAKPASSAPCEVKRAKERQREVLFFSKKEGFLTQAAHHQAHTLDFKVLQTTANKGKQSLTKVFIFSPKTKVAKFRHPQVHTAYYRLIPPNTTYYRPIFSHRLQKSGEPSPFKIELAPPPIKPNQGKSSQIKLPFFIKPVLNRLPSACGGGGRGRLPGSFVLESS
jgi:hypothetical protein